MEHEPKILLGDCLDRLKELPDNSVDLLATDPPYGYSFMGKDWDKAVPSVDVWKECLRVLKPGAFAFVMSAPRQDVLSQTIVRIGNAEFDTDFTSMYWTYASGFPKAMNIGKVVDKRGGVSVSWFGEWLKDWRKKNGIAQRDVAALFPSKTGGMTGCVANWELGLNIPTPEQFTRICRHFNLPFDSIEVAEREVVGRNPNGFGRNTGSSLTHDLEAHPDITIPKTDAAKALDGSYGGFQPKPAVEVVIVAMKPLSEKTFVDQALKNGHGVTWLDDARIPTSLGDRAEYGIDGDEGCPIVNDYGDRTRVAYIPVAAGRFPANLLISDDVLNDGHVRTSGKLTPYHENHQNHSSFHFERDKTYAKEADSGSYSRYFDLDAWFSERIKDLPESVQHTLPYFIVSKASKREKAGAKHPTVKPIKLMSYLITLGSRPGDLVLDPFVGSGTTPIACKLLDRKFVAIEKDPDNYREAVERVAKWNVLAA